MVGHLLVEVHLEAVVHVEGSHLALLEDRAPMVAIYYNYIILVLVVDLGDVEEVVQAGGVGADLVVPAFTVELGEEGGLGGTQVRLFPVHRGVFVELVMVLGVLEMVLAVQLSFIGILIYS